MNRVVLVGNICTDITKRTTQSGVSVATFRIAVNRKYANAQGQREADFIDCVAWRQTADFIAQHFIKGNRIGVEGSIHTRTYDAQDGSKRHVVEVVLDSAEFVAPKAQGAQNAAPAQTQEFQEVQEENLPF